MCGIAGSCGVVATLESVETMVRELRHRGPDDQGTWVSPNRECVLGHARLSIIDLSDAGHQPMVDPLTGNAISFNGEIYNYVDLRAELVRQGERFQSETDTEVILALYRRLGESCLSELRGMFAFAIWDAGRKHLFFARDRVGKKPFNYAHSPGAFTFCSEIRPLARLGFVSEDIDFNALGLYLNLQYIPAPWTIYQSVRKLPPGHYGIWTKAGLRLTRYWRPDYTSKSKLSEQDALEGLEERLRDAVRIRLRSDVPLGALLSGGVDSSLVVALMSQEMASRVRTFNIGWNEPEYDERRFANAVARRWNTSHTEREMAPAGEEVFPLIARHYGEPFGDSSALPSFLVCATARRDVTVALNGDGGDELLGGYPRDVVGPLSSIIGGWLERTLPRQLIGGPARWQGNSRKLMPRLIRRLGRPLLPSVLRFFGTYNGLWTASQRRSLLQPGVQDEAVDDWFWEAIRDARRTTSDPVDAMIFLETTTYLPGALLPKMDIASMHCSLEVRSPLLDHKLIEFCATLPPRYKSRNGVGKFLLKKLARKYIPAEAIDRPKMGFGIPRVEWLRGRWKQYVESRLRRRDLLGDVFSMKSVEAELRSFMAGAPGIDFKIWLLLMFAEWRESARSA